jgi:HEAT repeat protein
MDILQQLGVPEIVSCLEKALNHELDYDPGRLVPIFALNILAGIGSPEAIRLIRTRLDSPDIRIREEAQLLMEEFT